MTDNIPSPVQEPSIHLIAEDALLFDFASCTSEACQQRLWHLLAFLYRSSTPEQALSTDPELSQLAQQLTASLSEIVPGPFNLMIRLQPETTVSLGTVTEMLEKLWGSLPNTGFEGRQIDIPVLYGSDHGPDLDIVAEYTSLSAEQVIELHSSARYQVLCLGFMPGFAYLGGLDPRLNTPRRDTPRIRIPAGSVGIGGAQTGIYPLSSPGGWQIIGHTTQRLFSVEPSPNCLLQPGDSVRFIPTCQ